MTPKPTRRQNEHRRDRSKANQLKMRVFWHQGPQEDRKSTEETETKQINLRWEFLTPRPTRRQKEHRRDSLLTRRPTRRQKKHRRDRRKQMGFFWHQGPQEDRKSTEETETKQTNLRWEVFDTKAHKNRKSTEETETKQINLRWEFLTPRPTRRQKEHRRDRNKANQLKMRVFWHQGPQEDRKSTEETETKQINLRWEFFDTKAHKKTERAQKRQKQS